MNVPKLRFKEFNEEWNYYSLKDLINTKSKIYNPQKNNINYKCIELEHINQNCGTINGYFESLNQKSSKNIFYKNEVLFGKLRPYLRKYWYSTFDGVCSSEIWVLKSNNQKLIQNIFIFYIVQNNFFIQLCNLSTGSKMPRADWSYISEQPLAIPTVKEQEKIGTFLSLLDKKIELQSKKIEALKLYKMCIKKVVFKDKKTWESKNIFEVLDFEQPNKYLVYSEDYIDDKTMIPVLTANKGFILGYCNEDNYYNKGDSIIFDDFTMDMKYTTFPYKIKSSAIKILTPKNNNNLKFLYESLLSLNLSSEEHKRHYISIVQNMVIQVPNIDIQNKVAKILSTYDKKIEQEKLKFEKLESLKKGLMQNMFI